MISLVRTTSGSIGVQYSGANQSDAGVGKISGDGVLLFGATENADGTVQSKYVIEQADEDSSLKLEAGKVAANIEANGYNMYLDMNSGSASMNVAMNTVNSVYDRRFNAGSDIVTTSQNSANNLIEVGGGTDAYVDQGYYNVATGAEGAKTWWTTETSDSAIILGAEKGTNSFLLQGKNGAAIATGTSMNSFVVDFNAQNNMIVADGLYNQLLDNAGAKVENPDGTVTEYSGGRTLYIAGAGAHSVTANGNKSLYDLRNTLNSEVTLYGARNSYVFKADKDESGKYNIYDVLLGKTGDSAITNWSRSYVSGTYAAQAASNLIDPVLLSLFRESAE